MSGELTPFRTRLDTLKTEAGVIESMLTEEKVKYDGFNQRHTDASDARVVIQEATNQTQKHLEFRMSELVTDANKSVFPKPNKFIVRFVQRRGSTECDLLFEKNGNEMKPEDGAGGGPIDVTSFSLRVSFWSLRPDTRPIMILDEPFRFVSFDLQELCAEMLKVVSKELGIQIIMVSHLPNIIGCADKLFRVFQPKGGKIGVSKTQEIQ